MIRFTPCKINLGLHVLSRRSDGYHNIDTCFYPVPWNDALEVIKTTDNSFNFSISGIPVPGEKNDNLVTRAYQLLCRDFPLGGAMAHLHKCIPAGAGLGGGSSDAACTLLLLNEVFQLGLSADRLEEYASTLGSDCAFFIRSQPVIGRDRGNVFEPTSLSLMGKYLVIVKPDVHVSTAEAYKSIAIDKKETEIMHIIEDTHIKEWRDVLVNDFEPFVFHRHPEVKEIKATLYELGALYASMSGSGSAVFGIYDHEVSAEKFQKNTVWSGFLQ